MENGIKTNAMRLLSAGGVLYTTMEYEVDEADLSGLTVAKKTGFPPDQLFKTLVLKGKNGA
jgi:Cys-tRNA(Pro)/Cys-tRNA(Cys) deacylase